MKKVTNLLKNSAEKVFLACTKTLVKGFITQKMVFLIVFRDKYEFLITADIQALNLSDGDGHMVTWSGPRLSQDWYKTP